MADKQLSAIDSEGETVVAGDIIAFAYGIPPVRVQAPVVEKKGHLVALTTGHKPAECRLSALPRYVGIFWKITKPVRVKRERTADWRMPDNTVYVGRPTKWKNPFIVGQEYVRRKMTPGGGEKSGIVRDREHAVHLFNRFTVRETAFQIDAGLELRGKNLACWCPLDQPCHADVLLEIANG